jgi:hypothetical protein
MFSHHLLEILDRFERYVVFRIAKIHERARVNAVIRNDDFNRAVRVDSRNGSMFAACRKRETQSNEYDGYFKQCAGAHSNLDVR